MKSLRDMPMISVEQKNAFREAALKVEEERDEMGVWLDECLLTMRYASQFLDEYNKGAVLAMREMDRLSSRSSRLCDIVARRDARMKAEALEEACRKLSEAHYGNAEVGFDDDLLGAEDMVGDIAAKYRKQAEGES